MRRLGGRWRPPLPVLVPTAASIVLALALTYLVIASAGGRGELRSQDAENSAVANLLASDAHNGMRPSVIAEAKRLLIVEDMRATINWHGHRTTLGVALPAGGGLTIVSRLIAGGGSVSVASSVNNSPDPPFLAVLVSFGALVLVLGVAVTTNVLFTRATRRRVKLAVAAAERISAGDFGARIGAGGPEPLGSLGKAFDSMASRLAQVDSDQRELLADLAHEIATPINAVSGFAKAVLDGTIPGDRAYEAIDGQTARLSELLDELAQLRAVDASGERAPETVDLRFLVGTTLAELEPMTTHVRLRRRLSKVVVTTDPQLTRTIVRNLLTNAFRFTPPGGSVEVSTSRSGTQASVTVKDTGPGIPLEHQGRIFDRFYRAETARDRTRGGSGLGLAIARRAADSIGGRLELRSSVGEGSEFRLVLPVEWPASPGV